MKYKKLNNDDIYNLERIVSKRNSFFCKNQLKDYSHDETEDLIFYPEILLKPKNVDEVSLIVQYCNNNVIPVTACGARTGLSGGMLPVKGGVLLSLERMNDIINIDERNLQAIVEPGVINQFFKDRVEEKNLFYPPDPASKGSCTLGGNVMLNAGGPKALKYGVTKDYILNLEVVLPNGEVIWTGANVLKNSTGYNLTDLFIGSEGTLGIVTKIVVKLIPLPKYDISLLIPFKSIEKACESVSAIFRAGITPSALEFIERDALLWTMQYTDIFLELDNSVNAHLLIEVDGDDLPSLYIQCENIEKVVKDYESEDILIAESASEKNNLWRIRKSVGEAVKRNSIYKEEDTVVPRAELPKLISGIKLIGKKYGFKSLCYGHAGDGNLHVNIIKGDLSDFFWNNDLNIAIREIFILTKSLGGTISGEHGIGYVQKQYLDIVFTNTEINLQRGIKCLFDPNNIMNPDKIFN